MDKITHKEKRCPKCGTVYLITSLDKDIKYCSYDDTELEYTKEYRPKGN